MSGRIRRFYTGTYKSLDQFDSMWYECSYQKRDRNWVTCFAWAVILASVINARSAYCEASGKREPVKTFVRELVTELHGYISNLKE